MENDRDISKMRTASLEELIEQVVLSTCNACSTDIYPTQIVLECKAHFSIDVSEYTLINVS
jgi:hypothetical protein